MNEIRCHSCGKLLQDDVIDEDIFSDEKGEDICEVCYYKYIRRPSKMLAAMQTASARR